MPTVISTSPAVNQKREAFFRAVFGSAEGYVCLAYRVGPRMHQEFFKYPEQLPSMLEFVNRSYHGKNMYFCPQLLRGRERKKEEVLTCTCLWADLDECDPGLLNPKASIVLESSPGRWQAIWLLNKKTDPLDAEDICHRIAYRFREYGMDQSGWDLTQLLRIPLTYNVKYEVPGNIPVVELYSWEGTVYAEKDFNAVPPVPGYEVDNIPMPDVEDLDPDRILEAHRDKFDGRIFELYNNTPQDKMWSQALWALEMGLLEAGLTPTETFVVCTYAKCNKFARDKAAPIHLWKDVCRANVRLRTRVQEVKVGLEVPDLLTTEEKAMLKLDPDTFVERFTQWAKTRGDAAPQYFQAGALTILSHLLSSVVKLPTSFGVMTLNLWFMILADTTLTRKSTAMEMAMDLLITVDPDAILATDGSLEGLLTAISARPNRSGIFWRDEFSGLLEAVKKKDYYAGMLEALTKLYDGRYQKRILRKETIEVKDPILIFFCGGIRSRILELMEPEHVLSGFVPRFIFIEALSDISQFKDIGPMTDSHDSIQSELLLEMQKLKTTYDAEMTIHVGEQKVTTKREWNASLTTAAWDRYNLLEKEMVRLGISTNKPEMYTPLFDRLCKSVLKTSVLLAASKRTPEDYVEVQLVDILRAISYMQGWVLDSIDVVENVGKTATEKRLDQIFKGIKQRDGTSRSVIMQHYHLTAREADWLFETLEQRGLIRRVRNGKLGGEVLYPAIFS